MRNQQESIPGMEAEPGGVGRGMGMAAGAFSILNDLYHIAMGAAALSNPDLGADMMCEMGFRAYCPVPPNWMTA